MGRHTFTEQELYKLRKARKGVQIFAAIHKPQVIMKGRVLVAPSLYPNNYITVDDTTIEGDVSNIVEGMELWVSRSSYEKYHNPDHRIRVKRYDSATRRLYIAEYGKGLVHWAVGDYLTVYDHFSVVAKHPRYANGTWFMDHSTTYVNQNYAYGPSTNIGPSAVGFYTGTTPECTLNYVSDDNVTLSPSSTISSTAWTFPTATASPTTSSSVGTEASPVEVTYYERLHNGGWHTCTKTDSEGAEYTTRRLTFCFSDGDEPYHPWFTNIDSVLQNYAGTTITVSLKHNEYTDEDIFPGARVVLFTKTNFGGVDEEIRNNFPHRANILFEGWVVSESIKTDPTTGIIELEVGDITRILEKARAYPVAGNSTDSVPTDWISYYQLTPHRLLMHWAKHRSTVASLVDIYYYGDYGNERILFGDLAHDFLRTQLEQSSSKIYPALIGADKHSSIYIEDDQMAKITTDRSLINVMQIEKRDIINTLVADRPIFSENAQQTTYAVGGSDYSTPYGGRSPGDPIGYYGSEVVNEAGWLAPVSLPQTTVISWAANIRAAANCDLYFEVLLNGYWPLDLYPQCVVEPPDEGFYTKKGYLGAGEQFIVREVEYMFEADEFRCTTRLLLAKVTDGADGAGGEAVDMTVVSDVIDAYDPGINDWNTGFTPQTLPDYDLIFPGVENIGPGSGWVVAVDPVTKNTYITNEFSSVSPHWWEILDGIDVYDMILDPYSPRITSGWTTGPLFSFALELDETNNIINFYKCGDLYNNPSPALLYSHTPSGTVNSESVRVEATANSTMVTMYYTSNYGCYLVRSIDSGVNWEEIPVGHTAGSGAIGTYVFTFNTNDGGFSGYTQSGSPSTWVSGSYSYNAASWPNDGGYSSGGYWYSSSPGYTHFITKTYDIGSAARVTAYGGAMKTASYSWYRDIEARIWYNNGVSQSAVSRSFITGTNNSYFTVYRSSADLQDVTAIRLKQGSHTSGFTGGCLDYFYLKGSNLLDVSEVNVPNVRVGTDFGFFDNKTYLVGYDGFEPGYKVFYGADHTTSIFEEISGSPVAQTPFPDLRILTDNVNQPVMVARNDGVTTDLQLYDGSWSDITPSGPYTVLQPGGAWDDMVDGQSILAVAGESDSVKDLIRTTDRGSSWITLVSGVSYSVIRRSGNNAWLGGVSAVYYTDDAGTTIYDKTGDLVINTVNVLLVL